MKAFEVPSQVKQGKLSDAATGQLCTVLRSLEGKRVVVSVREQKRRRSNDQNAYLWGVVYPAAVAMFRDAGNMVDADDVHDFCKLRVAKLGQNIVTPDGEVVKTLGSTAKLTTAEFSDYIERIRAWAAEFGCVNPDPESFNQPKD